jgi:hypothetical protein
MDEADQAVGRPRDDLEELCAILERAGARYVAGTTAAYRNHRGSALPPSASGREITPTLTGVDIPAHRRDKERATWLFRSCLHRLEDNLAERYECQWLINRRECETLEPSLARMSEPWPIDWFGDQPAPE